MFKLDHGGKDKEKLKKALPSLSEIQEHQSGWKDDFQLNSALRRKFRVGILTIMFPFIISGCIIALMKFKIKVSTCSFAL